VVPEQRGGQHRVLRTDTDQATLLRSLLGQRPVIEHDDLLEHAPHRSDVDLPVEPSSRYRIAFALDQVDANQHPLYSADDLLRFGRDSVQQVGVFAGVGGRTLCGVKLQWIGGGVVEACLDRCPVVLPGWASRAAADGQRNQAWTREKDHGTNSILARAPGQWLFCGDSKY
jgi:hypothetical protein